jgi:hypothetical protein
MRKGWKEKKSGRIKNLMIDKQKLHVGKTQRDRSKEKYPGK